MSAPWPSITAEMLCGGAPILVLAPHPDDESLGCGALLAHGFAHHGANVICLTDGSASHPGSRDWPPERLAEQRRRELTAALESLGGGAEDLSWYGLRDSALHDHNPEEIAERIAGTAERLGARHLFAPATEDEHCDHKTAARIARLVLARQPGLKLYSYPIWSRWNAPDFDALIAHHRPLRLGPGAHRAAKRAAIACHHSQLGKCVTDDPQGFTMDPAFVAHFAEEDEIYWSSQP
ncbi:PIG-L deacetylase family protein [Sulfitobacter aestuarii]|uniref:PIG-L deacetylase family protein n=1 Tax=Sulfitobacter aestuarii TaxID=2161676 RepID=A0ABW5U339_9RHOB